MRGCRRTNTRNEHTGLYKKPMQLRDIENRSASRKVGGSTHESKETIKGLIDKKNK